MIVKRLLNPVRVVGYVLEETILSLVSSTFVFLLAYLGHYPQVAFPPTIIAVIATALAFFIGFNKYAHP